DWRRRGDGQRRAAAAPPRGLSRRESDGREAGSRGPPSFISVPRDCASAKGSAQLADLLAEEALELAEQIFARLDAQPGLRHRYGPFLVADDLQADRAGAGAGLERLLESNDLRPIGSLRRELHAHRLGARTERGCQRRDFEQDQLRVGGLLLARLTIALELHVAREENRISGA